MKSFFKTLLATVVGFFVSLILLFVVFASIIAGVAGSFSKEEVTVKDNSILTIDLGGVIDEREIDNPFQEIMGDNNKIGLRELLRSIAYASEDEKIKGILLLHAYSPNSYATLQEIRDALVEFKSSGKFVYAFSEMLEEHAYYVSSMANKIYLHPTGDMVFNGSSYQVMYLKNMFDKIGVEIQLIRHGKYKSAGESLITDKMSDENREQIKSFSGSIYHTYLKQIADSRKKSFEEVLNISMQLKIRTSKDAVDLGMIDGLKYKDEVEDELRELTGVDAGKDLKYVSLDDYNAVSKDKNSTSKNKIAIIYAVGEIVSGEGDNEQMGSEEMVKAISKARKDSSIKAVVLRINSPGGSALASDVIWREVILTKKVKPVIVSMGAVAASGGYYIAAPADKIVAEPTTITGSIGVFGALPNAQKLLNDKLGIRIEKVNMGEFADIGSPDRPLTTAEYSIIQSMIDRIYDDFITKVSTGRSLSKSQVDSIAQGRVWSGQEALAIGLVDTLGGIKTALAIAAQAAGLDEYKVTHLPVQKDPFEKLLKSFKTQTQSYFLKQELGDFYPTYVKANQLMQIRGVQARMLWDIK
jgi:protease-4